MTVAEMDSKLELLIDDVNEQTWSQARRIESLNTANLRAFNNIMSFLLYGEEISNVVYDLLSTLQTTETPSVPSTGYAVSGFSTRYYVENGYISAFATLSGDVRYFTKVSPTQIGREGNAYTKGTNIEPKLYMFGGKINLLIDTGFSLTTTFNFIGKPYGLVLSSPTSAGKDSTVTVSDLSIIFHDAVVQYAAAECFAFRSDENDLRRYQLYTSMAESMISDVVMGILGSPSEKQPAQGAEIVERFKKRFSNQRSGVQ